MCSLEKCDSCELIKELVEVIEGLEQDKADLLAKLDSHIDVATAGKRGGESTIRKHGLKHFQVMGSKGGKTNAALRGHDYFVELGRKGQAGLRASRNAGT